MKTTNILLAAMIALSSCSKKDDTSTPNNTSTNNTNTGGGNSITINSSHQVWMKIDGNVYSKIVDGNNIENSVGASKSINLPNPTTAVYQSFFDNPNTSEGYFGVEKGTLTFSGSVADSATFHSFYTTGSLSYSPSAFNGIRITYFDSTGDIWSTDFGSSDQTGSAFNITDIRTFNIFDYTVVIRATFNCKVYNLTGGVKTLTEGVFVGSFASI